MGPGVAAGTRYGPSKALGRANQPRSAEESRREGNVGWRLETVAPLLWIEEAPRLEVVEVVERVQQVQQTCRLSKRTVGVFLQMPSGQREKMVTQKADASLPSCCYCVSM